MRLYQGDYGKAQRYESDPVAVAARFEALGARRIHVVDLDAARGSGENREVIGRIAAAVSAQVEVGGGIRSRDDVDALTELGVDYLIIGTLLVRDPDLVATLIDGAGERFIAGIDARDGVVRVSGWEEGSTVRDVDLAKTAAGMGFGAVVYTNIAVDGTLAGPDLVRTNEVAAAAGIDVILSGGISSTEDVSRVVTGAHPNVLGMITGKAIYEGSLDLERAIELARAGT